MGSFRITIDGESSYEKQILPGTQAGFNSLKTFYLPHSDNDYHKKITYNEVFKAVKKKLQESKYNNLPSSLKYFLYKSLPSIGKVITRPQRGRLDGCEPSQRRPIRTNLFADTNF